MPVAVVDFDNTICNWNGVIGEYGEPVPGALKAIVDLKNQGYTFVLHTCRTAAEASPGTPLKWEKTPAEKARVMKEVLRWLSYHNFPIENVWVHDKPFGDVYLDDRAVYFNGDWDETTREVLSRET